MTIDTDSSLLALYLSLVMGFKALFNCDIQRLLQNNVYANHFVTFCCFLFLISLLDGTHAPLSDVWLKTIFIYILFMLFVKSKIESVIIVFILLVIDQSLKTIINNKLYKNPNEDVSTLQTVRQYIMYTIIATILIGCLLYYFKQKEDHSKDFSFLKFFFGTPECRDVVQI